MKLKRHKYHIYLLNSIAIILIVLQCYWSIKQHFITYDSQNNGISVFEKFNSSSLNEMLKVEINEAWVALAFKKDFEKLKLERNKKYDYFIYVKDQHGYTEPLYWTTRTIAPSFALLNSNDTTSFVANKEAYYTYKKQSFTKNNKSYLVIAANIHYKGYDATSKHLYNQWFNTNNEIAAYSFINTDNKTTLIKNNLNNKKPFFKYYIVYSLLLIWVTLFFRHEKKSYENKNWLLFYLPLLTIISVLFAYVNNDYLIWDNNYIFLALQIILFIYAYYFFIKNVSKNVKIMLFIVALTINALFFATKKNIINIINISSYSLHNVAFLLALVFAFINLVLLIKKELPLTKITFINNIIKTSPTLSLFFGISLLGATLIGCTNFLLYNANTKNELQNLVKNVILNEESQNSDLETLVNSFEATITPNDLDYQLNTILKQKLDSFESVHNSTLTYTITKEQNKNNLPNIIKKIKVNNNEFVYIEINFEPKQNIRNTINAELFTSKNSQIGETNNYAYAVYKNDKLLLKNNSIVAPTNLTNQEITKLNSQIKIIDVAKGYKVIYEERKWSWLTFFTSFSYLFITALILSAMFLNGIQGFKNLSINNLPLPQKIFAVISGIVVLSFIIISWFIISKFNTEQKENNAKQLTNAAQILINEIKANINNTEVDDAVIMYDLSVNENLKKLMVSISSLQNSDINVYNKGGNLEVSTQPYLFNKNFISSYMNFEALEALNNYNLAQYLTFETIGDLNFQSIYMPITDKNNNTFAYINIPHYTSTKNFEQELNAFMATVINIMAFVLIVALLIGFYFSSIISKPLVAIANSMAKTNIMQYNEPLVYNGKDEIGMLVTQYNLMQKELYASIKKLAKDERETAWRLMAKQVAHEIKNPLTPMKLKIQLLERNINLKRGDITQMVKETNTLLIDQINHLAKIASDFSEFAQIESNHKAKLNITTLLEPIISLYQNENKVHITYFNNAQYAIVNADETQLKRLFINLVKNAIEACEDKEISEIIITQNIIEPNLIITIIDNGNGIPEDIIDKIFSPNFTTKSSGTGLGLAMCKTILNQHDGDIYFETGKNGTTFTLILPLAQ